MTENEGPALIDTNLWVYSLDHSDPRKQKSSRELIENIVTGGHAVVSNQVLAELFNSLSGKMRVILEPAAAAEAVNNIFNSEKITKINYTAQTASNAAKTSSSKSGIHFWDALIAQTMLENGVKIIYTENEKDFKKIAGIKVVNPFK